MEKLWLLLGDHEAPGWDELRRDLKEEKVDIRHLDPRVWALIRAAEPPHGYEGLRAEVPADGMYIDPNGSPSFVVGAEFVGSAREVIDALGAEASALFARLGDAETTLERLGKVY